MLTCVFPEGGGAMSVGGTLDGGSEDLGVPLLPLQDTEPDPGGHLTPPAQKSPHAEGRAFNGWLQNLRDGRVVPTRAVMPNQEAGPCPGTLRAVPGRHGCWEMVFGADSSLGGGGGWHAHLPPPTRKTWNTLTRVVNNHQHLQTVPDGPDWRQNYPGGILW